MAHDEQRAKLIGFSEDGARSPPPVFVGRDEAISDILRAADRVHERWLENPRKPQRHAMTRLIQGAPGAGKSTLVERIQELAGQGAAPSGTQHLALFLSASELSRPGDLEERISAQMPGGLLATAAGAAVKLASSLLIGSSRPASGAADKAERAVRQGQETRFPGTLLLMIDEAQQAAPHSPEANALRTLHQALHSLPILPMFAGLGHLQGHLKQEGIGISRFAGPHCIHTIGALSPEESDGLLGGWLDHFEIGAKPRDLSRWQDAMRRDAQGWAMHTYDFLAPLARALADSPRPRRLSAIGMDAVRQAAAANRNRHYSERYADEDGVISDAPDGVARLMARLRETGPQSGAEIRQTIQDAFKEPTKEGAAAWRQTLMARGFLQPVSTRQGMGLPKYACPIPSLASYAAAFELPLHLEASAGDAAAVEEVLFGDPSAISRIDAMGRTALHVAAEGRWGAVADALIKAGADPQAKDAAGTTPAKAWPDHGWPRSRAAQRALAPLTSGR
ncbi:MAG: NACHT domain-containing protein [Gammaproteobacteria bacterium]|nr:NACHT domain-containing protein [Gammaproteobacteria bacterium]